jgi:hypothetical protein
MGDALGTVRSDALGPTLRSYTRRVDRDGTGTAALAWTTLLGTTRANIGTCTGTVERCTWTDAAGPALGEAQHWAAGNRAAGSNAR